MPISQLFADNILVRLIRGGTAHRELFLSMAGIKLGERLLVLGLADPATLTLLGAKVGLTGRICGVSPSADMTAGAERRAQRDGILVEIHTGPYNGLPYGPDSFDVAVIRPGADLGDRQAMDLALTGAKGALRDGGRALIIAETGSGGLTSYFSKTPILPASGLVQALSSQAYRGARILAERDGFVFVEGVSRHT